VEDSSSLRRGFPVAHSIYGVPQTINSANYIYFCALRELERLNNPQLFKIFYGTAKCSRKLTLDELINLHRGQGMDLFWRDTLTCPTEEEYIEMVNNKTGGLLRLAVKLMQACSSSAMYTPVQLSTDISDYVSLVNLIGILFQIRDDYQNLQDTQYTNNKGLCEDITEGKFSFPIIHAILSRPDDRQLLSTTILLLY
jgi:geranylgeranyl diphosphate synthase, type III